MEIDWHKYLDETGYDLLAIFRFLVAEGRDLPEEDPGGYAMAVDFLVTLTKMRPIRSRQVAALAIANALQMVDMVSLVGEQLDSNYDCWVCGRCGKTVRGHNDRRDGTDPSEVCEECYEEITGKPSWL